MSLLQFTATIFRRKDARIFQILAEIRFCALKRFKRQVVTVLFITHLISQAYFRDGWFIREPAEPTKHSSSLGRAITWRIRSISLAVFLSIMAYKSGLVPVVAFVVFDNATAQPDDALCCSESEYVRRWRILSTKTNARARFSAWQ